MTTQAHTPTPWKLSGLVIIRDVKSRRLQHLVGDVDSSAAISHAEKIANGELIVQAVNAYNDNQALIAEQAAEIARLREHLEHIREIGFEYSGTSMKLIKCWEIAGEALQAQEVAK